MLFQEVSQGDVLLHADTKVSLVKIYCEQSEFEALDYLLDSFSTFIQRHKELSDFHRLGYRNFIKYVKKLTQAQSHSHKKKLIEAIEQEKILPEKQWILQQLKL